MLGTGHYTKHLKNNLISSFTILRGASTIPTLWVRITRSERVSRWPKITSSANSSAETQVAIC